MKVGRLGPDKLVDRCTEIEKANRLLLERMTNIMTSQPLLSAGFPAHQISTSKRLGQVSSHVHVGSADGAANARSKSLNRN